MNVYESQDIIFAIGANLSYIKEKMPSYLWEKAWIKLVDPPRGHKYKFTGRPDMIISFFPLSGGIESAIVNKQESSEGFSSTENAFSLKSIEKEDKVRSKNLTTMFCS